VSRAAAAKAAYKRAALRLDKSRIRWKAAQREMSAAASELDDALSGEFAAAKRLLEAGGSL
jgi:hypothetical protein